MKYWYDTEFIENGRTIDLISIGIVAEDGREYYAISGDCNFRDANDWVKENVIAQLPPLFSCDVLGKRTEEPLYRPLYRIRQEVHAFIGDKEIGWTTANGSEALKPELWGYYSAYDHIVLCQLFGTMMQLPPGWPMYTRDIKQWCDQLGNPALPALAKGEHHALQDARWNKASWEFLADLSLRKDGE